MHTLITRNRANTGWYADFTQGDFHTHVTIIEDNNHYWVSDPFDIDKKSLREWTFERAFALAEKWAKEKYNATR